MQNNEESILIKNKKTKKKIDKEIRIKKPNINDYFQIIKKNLNLTTISLFIVIIIIFILYIKVFKPLYEPPAKINLDNPSSDSENIINGQPLITELTNKIKSFEVSPISNPQSIQKNPSSKNPQISIIIPVFNNAEKIKLTIHSIQFQNISDIEIIIVDDNSEDNTKQFIEEAQKEDPRIKLLKNQNNKGILYTRSIGVLNSKGKLVFTINSGDVFINDIFNICLEQSIFNDIDIIEFSYYNFSYLEPSIYQIPISFIDEKTIMQPELSNIMYKEKNDSGQKYELIDKYIWGKCIKNELYKKAIEMLNLLMYSERVFFFESEIINFGLFKIAYTFKFLNKKGIIHIFNKKSMIDKKQFFQDNIKYIINLFKNSHNGKDVEIAIYELEIFFNLYPNEFVKDHKKLLFELFEEINNCDKMDENKKDNLEVKMKDMLNKKLL